MKPYLLNSIQRAGRYLNDLPSLDNERGHPMSLVAAWVVADDDSEPGSHFCHPPWALKGAGKQAKSRLPKSPGARCWAAFSQPILQ